MAIAPDECIAHSSLLTRDVLSQILRPKTVSMQLPITLGVLR